MFVNFLSKREPFKQVFNEPLAKEFYKNIRCPLLHEAATRGGWVIRIDTDSLIKNIWGRRTFGVGLGIFGLFW